MRARDEMSTAVAVLALVQGVLGILRALQWIEVGGDLSRTGVVLMPILGLAAIARGVFVAVMALLYMLFAWGAFTGKAWAQGMGLAACAVNLLAVVVLVVSADSLAAALVWAVAPAIIGGYLLRRGRAGHLA